MSNAQYGDYQFEIYFDGLDGRVPKYPVDYPSLERAAGAVLPSFVYSYVAAAAVTSGCNAPTWKPSQAMRSYRACSSALPNVTYRCRCST
jgi:hypothetical protein